MLLHRRDLIQSLVAAMMPATGAKAGRKSKSMEEFERRKAEVTAEMIASFPYQRIEVRGEDALSTWTKLRADKRGVPVVIGDDDAVAAMMNAFDPSSSNAKKSINQFIDDATRVKFPDDLFKRRKTEDEADRTATLKLISGPDSELPRVIRSKDDTAGTATYIIEYFSSTKSVPGEELGHTLTPEETRAYLSKQLRARPEIGSWPNEPPQPTQLTIATNILTGKPLPKVHIAIIPTKDWTTVPAHLRWGGWNDNPEPQYHVAALRYWRDRYGIELVGMSFDTMNLKTVHRPHNREEALALAREQYAYCTDIVDQGTETLSVLAAGLMSDDWWYFWWD
jgi:hypothetical protein